MSVFLSRDTINRSLFAAHATSTSSGVPVGGEPGSPMHMKSIDSNGVVALRRINASINRPSRLSSSIKKRIAIDDRCIDATQLREGMVLTLQWTDGEDQFGQYHLPVFGPMTA